MKTPKTVGKLHRFWKSILWRHHGHHGHHGQALRTCALGLRLARLSGKEAAFNTPGKWKKNGGFGKIHPKNRQFRKEHRQFECQQIMKSEGFLMVWWFSHHFFESRLNRRHLEGDFATGIWVKWRYTAKHQDWSSEDWTCQTNLPALDWNLVMTGWFDDWNSNPKTFSLFAMIQHKLGTNKHDVYMFFSWLRLVVNMLARPVAQAVVLMVDDPSPDVPPGE